MSARCNFLTVIGDRDALRWIVRQQRMAFPAGREREAARLSAGDHLLLYTTRGCFKNPTRDRGRVVGEAIAMSDPRSCEPVLEMFGRAFSSECPLRLVSLAPWRGGVELGPLIGRLEGFPDERSWPNRMRHTLVPLSGTDAALLVRELNSVAARPSDVLDDYRPGQLGSAA